VSVIMTVRNDQAACAETLDSLIGQTRSPDEVVIVDGGSTDGTIECICRYANADARFRLIEAPGVNIARGRNIAARAAVGEIIACIDSGCRAEPDWLEKLLAPMIEDEGVDFVAGFYRVDAKSLLEKVVGLATMRGQLDPPDPETFNPSARSMACKKEVWSRAGGWPEWIGFSEDTLFDHKVRRMEVGWRFACDAVVHWRPRRSLRAVAKQFYLYGTGRGHTQIGASGFAYNLRNLVLVAGVAACGFISNWALVGVVGLLLYFYVWTFHRKALRVARRAERLVAYPICLLVMWIVLASNTAGYVVGTWQRYRQDERYRHRMDAYLAG
jgi:glycosyltransferase involved in cell wall biosynthesis